MALNPINVVATLAMGSKTAAAGTAFQVFVPPHRRGRTVVVKLRVTTPVTTQITLVGLSAIGYGNLSSGVATNSLVLNLAAVTGNAAPAAGAGGMGAVGGFFGKLGLVRQVAANDWLAWENANGSWDWGQVASVSGLAVTMSASTGSLGGSGPPVAANGPSADARNVGPTGVALTPGAKVWLLGASTDAGQTTLLPPIAGSGTVDTTYNDDAAGTVVEGRGRYEPVLITCSNGAAAASTIQEVSVAYSRD